MQHSITDIELRYKLAQEDLPVIPEELDLLEALYQEYYLAIQAVADGIDQQLTQVKAVAD